MFIFPPLTISMLTNFCHNAMIIIFDLVYLRYSSVPKKNSKNNMFIFRMKVEEFFFEFSTDFRDKF